MGVPPGEEKKKQEKTKKPTDRKKESVGFCVFCMIST
jgi:hypothetical protein